MDAKLHKGTRVKIVKDVREGESATGKTGRFVGDKKQEAWILFDANGNPERESYSLPNTYVEWRPEKEDFPKVNCGIRSQNPIFRLEDGSEIHGGQCYWEPVNPRIKKRMEDASKDLLKKSGGRDPRES